MAVRNIFLVKMYDLILFFHHSSLLTSYRCSSLIVRDISKLHEYVFCKLVYDKRKRLVLQFYVNPVLVISRDLTHEAHETKA